MKNGWKVIANDKNKYVVALLKKVIFEGLDEKEVTKFITREKFNDVINKPDNYDDWYVGYVMCVWSFGNNQKYYLFGKDVEQYKLVGHELVINRNSELIQKLILNIPQKYIDGILKLDTWHKRRIALRKVSIKLKTRIFELQQLQLYNNDYREVDIPKNAVIYCDPPYQNSAEYKEDGFNHQEFWEWVRQQSKTNKVYISEYHAPDDFKVILRFEQRSTYAGGVNIKQPDECLFTIK